MSRTDEYINQLYEAGLVDRFGNRLYPDLHHHGDRQPVAAPLLYVVSPGEL